ncbi:MAG: YraN family protein [Candidatus Cloacimonas sp.]|nr:YraN family protein [Candidatus Cloacimonadota bacterium]
MEAKKLGKIGERLAAEYLTDNGYQVIRRNYHTRYGEIDIIAFKDDEIVFVEVKTRHKNRAAAYSNVSNVKQRRMVKSAVDFLGSESEYTSYRIRFDVVAIWNVSDEETFQIEHLVDAFRVDDLYEL